MRRKFNISEVLNILLALALIIVIIKNDRPHKERGHRNVAETTEVSANSSDAIRIIHQRKSVRNFIPRKMVSKEDLLTLVKAGMAAPTAKNTQPWEFIVITEPSMLDKLSGELPYAKMLTEAGGAIVVCGNLNNSLEGAAQAYWVQDCSAATQNVLLAAESLGLGAVWTGVFPIEDRVKSVTSELKLPAHIIPLCVIPIGYPTGKDQPKQKFKEEKLHWEQW